MDVRLLSQRAPWGGGGERKESPVAYFLYYMLDRIKLRIQGLDEVQTPLLT